MAKKHGGQFLLRIEDTDAARTIEGAKDSIQKDLVRMGMNYDFGPNKRGTMGSFVQSERTHYYQQYAMQLLDEGKAYRCFCTQERLESIKSVSQNAKRLTGYDQHCRNLTQEEVEKLLNLKTSFVIRFKVPMEKSISYTDLVFRKIEIPLRTIDDMVLLKSDGLPTYHLANVVDDHLMKVSHVFRGKEWLPSTPKHILLYRAFNWESPQFGHLPLLYQKNGMKLSKRNNDLSLEKLLDDGFLPEAILNFVALLGWTPIEEKEIYSLNDLVGQFDISRVNRSGAVVDYMKLKHLNQLHLRANVENPGKRVVILEKVMNYLQDKFQLDVKKVEIDKIERLLLLVYDRAVFLNQIPELMKPFLCELDFDCPAAKILKNEIGMLDCNIVSQVKSSIENLNSWNKDEIKNAIQKVVIDGGFKYGIVMKHLRYLLTAQKVGIEVEKIIFELGKEKFLNRMQIR